MADFKYGGIGFPLDSSTMNSLLRDADPAVYYTLEFLASVINTHVGDRLVAEAAAIGATDIATAVADAMPIDPEQFLTEEHLKFPLLTVHREGTTFKYLATRRVGVHRLKVAYVLPTVRAAQAERLLPILHAVGVLIDKKVADGKDSAYTPTLPDGTAGEFIWTGSRACVVKAEVKELVTGAFQISNDLFFPAVVLTLELWETGAVPADATQEDFEGADNIIDLEETGAKTEVEQFIEFNTQRPPTVTSLLPTSGTASGGTAVTIAGTGFTVGTRPIVLFNGSAADAVTVVDSTTITCLTPPHAAYPSVTVDVLVIAADGQTDTLEDAFTFNNP